MKKIKLVLGAIALYLLSWAATTAAWYVGIELGLRYGAPAAGVVIGCFAAVLTCGLVIYGRARWMHRRAQ